MAINVYWACVEEEWAKALPPEKINKKFYSFGINNKDSAADDAINHCPVFNESINNVYAIRSIYDYSFKIEGDKCTSLLYNQKFFDDHVFVRSLEKKFFSFLVRYIFFTDSDSLEIMSGQHPFLEESEITKRCMLIPGGYDIGKHFRTLEFPFILRKDFNEFIVNDEDVLYYLTFNTKEKINFKQFRMTDDLMSMSTDIKRASNGMTKKVTSIEYFYNKFKGKRYILEQIEKNLLD
jgi:hypothetical protein